MLMFGLFKSAAFADAALGKFVRHRGYWVGKIDVPLHGTMELRLIGGRDSPDPGALALAHEFPTRYPSFRDEVQAALYDHYLPYAEALASGDLPERTEPFPRIPGPGEVWQYVYPSHVLIEPMEGVPTVEVAYRVEWDEEHTVGACFQDWKFLELCGSVI
jgi:hypothetical protein